MASQWYSRPVFFVRSAEKALVFYTEALGFRESWRHENDGAVIAVVAEPSRRRGTLTSPDGGRHENDPPGSPSL